MHVAARWTLVTVALMLGGSMGLAAQTDDVGRVRAVVAALARYSQEHNLSAMDTLYAPDAWVRVIEGAGVNNGWIDYRDNHLGPELAEMKNLSYRHFEIEPQIRGDVAWAPFRYELGVDGSEGRVEVEGRGTAILECRGARWLVVHLHTSGRRKRN